MNYSVIRAGTSRSFADDHPLIANGNDGGDAIVILGKAAGTAFQSIPDRATKAVVLVELGTECLGVHTGESRGLEGSNVLGFARFHLGDGEPSNLVELVDRKSVV